jgi:Flp pilus assembly protein TadG
MWLARYPKTHLTVSRLTRVARRLNADDRGVAAIEFCLVATFLTFSTLNVADISIYVYQRMEVENAAHAAVLAPS